MKKTTKRFLALLMTLTMVLSMGMQTFAAGTDADDTTQVQTIQTEQENGTEDDSVSVPESSEDQKATDKAVDTASGEALPQEGEPSAQSDDEGIALLSDVSAKPADGQTTGQPFAANTAGSQNFRIPAMVTLDDGTIVAAADARWNTTDDGYGLDTLVSRSKDGGETWEYTFANYLGDNEDVYNTKSTAFIDPALATDGETVYMLVDLFPGGVVLGNSQKGSGYDNSRHLLLKQSGSSSYDYYVGEFDADGFAPVCNSSGQQVDGYTVDEYYNLYQNKTMAGNVFFSDAAYQVTPTSYLYLTKSTDGGATWSAPTILNGQVKGDSDEFYGVGPGTGLVTKTGRIIFATYSHDNGIWDSSEYTSVIYSDDGGKTWTRSANMEKESSEAALVEADGNIYMFTRHGGYYVSSDNGANWSSQKSVSGISYNTGCQISALTYSEKIDGQTAILFSAPSSTSSRVNGKIFVGLVQDDSSINWKYTYAVNSGTYQYSCMAELSDGSVGLLYESGSAAITYTNLPIEKIASGAQIGTGESDGTGSGDVQETQDINISLDGNRTVTIDGTIGQEGSYTTADGLVAYSVKHESNHTEATTEAAKAGSISSGSAYLIGDGTNWLTLNGSTLGTTTDPEAATEWTVAANGSGYRLSSGNRYLTVNSRNNSLTTTTNSSSAKAWSWSGNSGFYYQGTFGISTYYLRYNNVWTVGTTNSNNGSAYTLQEVPGEDVEQTVITFTGLAVGTTSVIVGGYQFNVTVSETPDGEFSDIGELTFISETGSADYSLNQTISHLILTPGITYDLTLYSDGKALGSGYTVTWESADNTIASVNSSGLITANRVGETTVTAIVTDKEGKIVGRHIATVTVIDAGSGYYSRQVEFYIADVQNTTLYYVENGHTGDFDFVSVDQGTVIYGKPSDKWNMVYFAAPDEGYALTYLSAANNYGNTDWTSIKDNQLVDPNNTSFQDAYGNTYYNQVLQLAQGTYGADGCFWFTRGASDTGDCRAYIIAISEKLPTVDKTVAKVNNEDYTEDTVIHVGDTITFAVTVTRYKAQYGINYSNATLADKLSGAYFQGSSSGNKNISSDLGSSAYNAGTYTYYVDYKVQQSDLDTLITNTVDLEYSYQAAYSEGNYGGTANAQAEVSVLSFDPDDYIIDFGSPISVDYTGKSSYKFVSGSARFGTVAVAADGMNITYTPTAVLTEADTVTVVNEKGARYSFKVYPATSVYYEEGFASYSDGWTGGSKTTANQTASIANDETAELYGYDSLYASANGNSNNSVAVSSTKNKTAEFTFNGTGLDIYALTQNQSGSMSLWLYQGQGTSGTPLKLGYVDTSNNWLENNTGNYYNTPVFSYKDLALGTYTVKIVVNNGTISLDGFRVYNTQGDAYESVYAADNEANAKTAEVRDITIVEGTYNLDEIDDWYQYSGKIINAVYDATNNGTGAVILGEGNTVTADADMINNGPKNEIYLKKGQTIAMKLETSVYGKVAVGMRSLNGGNVSYKINGSEDSVSSTVDMYYEIKPSNGAIVIQNTGDAVLALTKIKVTGLASGTSLVSAFSMDTETMAFALRCIAGDVTDVVTADASLKVSVVDYKGNAVADTTLTATGVQGETYTFAAADIQAAAENALPEGYALTGTASDTEVAYGEEQAAELQAGKVAVLNVTYKNWLGKTVGTAQIVSPAQTSSKGSYLFTWNDVRKQVPDGYVLINLFTLKSVSYGSEKSMSVTVF